MRDHARWAKGFTLVELMIVVAIIGILASIAIPTFQKQIYRTKAAERPLIMQRIKQAIDDYNVVNGTHAPPMGFGFAFAWADWNPPWPPEPMARPLRENLPGWNTYFTVGNRGSMSSSIEGRLYYSYQFFVIEWQGGGQITLQAVGDLDGDGTRSQLYRWYQRDPNSQTQWVETEYPRDFFFPPKVGLEMEYGSWQIGEYF